MVFVYSVFRLLSLLMLYLPSFLGASNAVTYTDKIEEIIITPFNKDGSLNHMMVKGSFNDTNPKTVKFTYQVHGLSKIIYDQLHTENIIDLDLTYSLNDSIIQDGDDIAYKFVVLVTKPRIKYYENRTVHVNYKNHDIIRSKKEGIFTSGARPYYIYQNGLGRIEYDLIAISNCVNVQNDIYDRFDLREIHFGFFQPLLMPVNCAKAQATLLIYNYSNYFSTLSNEAIISVPLEVYLDEEKSEYYFRYKDQLYVDKYTHKPYLKDELNCIYTDYFYLPDFVFNEDLYDQTRFSVAVSNFGYANSYIIMNLYFNKNPNSLFGYCSSNDYCVTSDPASPDFITSKVVSTHA